MFKQAGTVDDWGCGAGVPGVSEALAHWHAMTVDAQRTFNDLTMNSASSPEDVSDAWEVLRFHRRVEDLIRRGVPEEYAVVIAEA